ncbi:Uncharacterized protein M6B38_211770 [Iris pallida]|uniref:EDRF1 N-terminal domain-containing protein n=1 Tax=Iris pallida TaxID=29817 RepID=A0AAX6E347_IRIPA|nr:Uncharacterized protein M6B38_211770 [Iris pallida]
MEDSGQLQCVGKLEIAKAKPVGFLCGTLPVPVLNDFPLSQSALVPSPLTIGAPRYQMLPTETDLNTLPLLSDRDQKAFAAAAAGAGESKNTGVPYWESGLTSQNLSRKCEALAVSGLTEYGDEIDVVAPTDILKQIFKIPYSKAQLSIAVHRVGDTLILNTGLDVEEGEKIFRRQNNQSKGSDPSIFLNFAMHSVRAEACDCPPTHNLSSEKPSNSTMLPGHLTSSEASFVSSTSSHASKSQFLNKNVSGSRKSTQASRDKYFWGAKQNKQTSKNPESVNRNSEVGEKPRCSVQDSDKFKRVGNDSFLRVLFWQFHNFRMLLGSDLLIFSNEKYVAVSLHLWDVARQVTPLTWLEAWLDNVMASVPEVAICYHDNGVVQGYELLKTDDIFLLKGISEDGIPAFHPQVVEQNGLSVLRFLQDNCKQDPGAYWLYKSAGEDVIQLFDLSVMPKNHSDDDHDKGCNSLPSLMHRGRKDSLFLLGTLLYRVAHRLSLSKAPDNRVKCAKFFKKCLDFLREQDHLVVRAYAHEQFARLILKCYEELELTSESFLLGSEVTVTDLEDESSEFSLGMFTSTAQDMVPSQAAENVTSTKDGSVIPSSGLETSGLKLEADSCTMSSSTEVIDLTEVNSNSKTHDSLDMCQISENSTHVVRTVTDPVSSKLAAIHHVSQAIKSLRFKRQLQNAQGDMVDQGYMIHNRSSNSYSLCACGDPDCIEVCDIRQWLPKSKLDHKMWNLVLLLGESYLALGEAYKEDQQLDRALKVVELACLVYGSMPQHLEDARFISSMVSGSSSQLNVNDGMEVDVSIDDAKDLGPDIFEGFSTNQFSPAYLFWAKAWSLVGDVYVEYHRSRGKENPVQAERKASGSELRMSNEVVREVKRLKKKLGQYNPNCSSCSLINCSCQSDRISSNNSASSSTGVASPSYSRKQSRKLNMKKSYHSMSEQPFDVNCSSKLRSASSDEVERLQNSTKVDTNVGLADKFNGKSAAANIVHVAASSLEESPAAADNVAKEDVMKADTTGFSRDAASFEPSTKSESRCGGIFKYLESSKSANAESNLSAAIACYDEARKAFGVSSFGSEELHSVVKKKGWVCNELGRYRLEMGNLPAAEIAFADAIKAFKEVSDHTNIILINCNLGHGRRAIAEELVTKMSELKMHDILQNAYKQARKTAKLEYFESLRYYRAAMTELASAGDVPDSLLLEVHTQFAHTYLKLGMLLAGESIPSEGNERIYSQHFYSDGKPKDLRKPDISASDAFREALSTYESLGDVRKQEAAFAHFQLACYHRDTCLKFLDLDQKQVNLSNNENNRQKAKWYASLAEKHWQKSIAFYGPKTHPAMHLNILMELSTISLSLWNTFHSNTMLEAALLHLLDGRQVVEENEDCKFNHDPDVGMKFWNQLQALLKRMLSASLAVNKAGAAGQTSTSNKVGDHGKLREMYLMSLKSTNFCQLHGMYNLWVS